MGCCREGAGRAGLSSPAMCPPVPFAPPRSASLAQVNSMLREQLDQASSANQALSEDIRKVTTDWTCCRKELEQREAAWRREEEVGMGVLGGRWAQPDLRGRTKGSGEGGPAGR